MRSLLLFLSCLCLSFLSDSQAQTYRSQNVKLLGTWDDPSINPNGTWVNNRFSSCWGYAQNGREYAVVGAQNGTYIVDISNPESPVKRSFIPGKHNNAVWREYKTYKNYLYCISDDGLPNSFQIVDLRYLPDSTHIVYDGDQPFYRGHTISIDKDNMYIAGGLNTLVAYSLKNPEKPVLARNLADDYPTTGQAHDMYVKNDTVYGSFGYKGLKVFYFNKSIPTFDLLGSMTQYPSSGYNHSSILTEDGKTLMMMDEVPNSLPIKMVDVRDLKDLKMLSLFSSGSKATPHNPFPAPNNRIVVSYYEDGIQIFNVKDPKNVVRTGFFDSHPESDSLTTSGAYLGNWSAYTELPSKNVILVDMQHGLFVLDAKIAYGMSVASKDLQLTNEVSVWPNPTHAQLIFSSPRNEIGDISVFDMSGREILSYKNQQLESFSMTFSEEHPAGVYFIKIRNDRFLQNLKVIKN
ncbi:MAG: choice-of-anchor B family protein [Saprospiraceae bacterium]